MRFAIHSYDTLPSTQILAKECCAAGKAKSGDVFQSDIQTGGYGRRGREWQSPKGNLYFTLIESYDDPAHVAWLSFAMGLGLYEAAADYLPSHVDLKLKWPNDLLLNGAKMSGLLLEVVDDKILIGVGVNIASVPETDQAITALTAYRENNVTPHNFLKSILEHYDRWYEIGLEQGFAGLRTAWLEKAAFKGEMITARLANSQTFQGVFIDLDPSGALVLQTEGGSKLITSADIYLPPSISET